MTQKRQEEILRALCAQIEEGDGADPRRPRRQRNFNGGRKDMQLCAQVKRAIESALAAEVADPVLIELECLAVEPAPTVRRLRITFASCEPALATERLHAARGLLRSAVATAISRKRVPELEFVVLGQEPGDES